MTTDAAPVPELLAREIELVPIDSVRPHPLNPNQGDVDAIGESADEVGFYQIIGVQRSSGLIVFGEHRWKLLVERGSPVAPVVFYDWDDAQTLKVLVGDNEIPRQHSRADDRALAHALQALGGPEEGALAGTGHDAESLRKLLAGLADPTPPLAFPDAEALAGHIEHRCPSCGYSWSGSPTPAVD
jgi:ParB-like chromosome segregation protein Spo0J